MISYLASVAAGNAVEALLKPPAGALRWKLLRKRTDDIAAADDPAANVILDSSEDKFVIDRYALANGTEYFYRVFYFNGTDWTGAPSRSVTPACALSEISTDVIEIVRERIDLGFTALVDRGDLQHESGHIPVLLATPEFDNAQWPLITVHMTNESQAERFVGEIFAPDAVGGIGDDDDGVYSYDGQLTRYTLTIIVWCLNGDMRNQMRRYLGAVVRANLPVFESTQMSLVEASFADFDDVATYPAPVYQSTCTLSCVAPSVVENHIPRVAAVVAGTGPVPIDAGEGTPADEVVVGSTGAYCSSCN